MNYRVPPKFRFSTKKGWINDPNGLVFFNGYYHIFYQHSPNFEKPWQENMHQGHARTENFLEYEELPVALFPDMPYDKDGCWSGTAAYISVSQNRNLNDIDAKEIREIIGL